MAKTQIFDETNDVTSGFFNGAIKDGKIDRTYDANDISSMFDGLITDGIFSSIGQQFACRAGDSADELIVKVGTGKAWLNKTWITNNAVLDIKLDAAPSGKNKRIDLIVIDIDKRDVTRKNTIQYIPGEAAQDPQCPTLVTNDALHKQYELCRIYVDPGITDSKKLVINDDRKVNFVTGPDSTIDSESLLTGWSAHFQSLYDDQEVKFKDELTNLGQDSKARVEAEITTWKNDQQASFDAWFAEIQATLSGNPTANLTKKVEREKINRLLQNGFEQCTKTISEDGKTITSYNSAEVTVDPDSDTYYKIKKTFNDDFSESTTTLSNKQDVEIAKMTKEVDPTDPTGNSFITNIVYKQV